MKRTTIIILACMLTTMAAMAQTGLNINRLFDGRYKAQAEIIENLVVKDGAKAIDKEVEYRNGQLYYGFYTLPKYKRSNRYIFFLNQNLARKSPKNVVTLIYMEGEASAERIKKLIRK